MPGYVELEFPTPGQQRAGKILVSQGVRVAPKVVQIALKIRQIWDFLRSVSEHFGSANSPRFVSFGDNLTQFGANTNFADLSARETTT